MPHLKKGCFYNSPSQEPSDSGWCPHSYPRLAQEIRTSPSPFTYPWRRSVFWECEYILANYINILIWKVILGIFVLNVMVLGLIKQIRRYVPSHCLKQVFPKHHLSIIHLKWYRLKVLLIAPATEGSMLIMYLLLSCLLIDAQYSFRK